MQTTCILETMQSHLRGTDQNYYPLPCKIVKLDEFSWLSAVNCSEKTHDVSILFLSKTMTEMRKSRRNSKSYLGILDISAFFSFLYHSRSSSCVSSWVISPAIVDEGVKKGSDALGVMCVFWHQKLNTTEKDIQGYLYVHGISVLLGIEGRRRQWG